MACDRCGGPTSRPVCEQCELEDRHEWDDPYAPLKDDGGDDE